MKKFFNTTFHLCSILLTVFLIGIGLSQGAEKQAGPQGGRLETTFKHRGNFSVVLIGTGSPQYDPERSGPSTLIHYNGHYFLVDMGNGTQVRLLNAGIVPGDIETWMFTHHHLDHNEEYIPLSIGSWLRGRRHLNLVGPPNTRALHEFLITFYKEDMEYRARRRGRPVDWDGMITNVDIKEVSGDEIFEIHGVKITTTRVKHTIHTQAYRFDADGKSIVISGDLSYSENLITLAKNTDVLVMDAGQVMRKQQRPPSGTRPQRRSGAQGTRAHSNLEEVATMATKANVKKLVLIHLPQGIIDKEATLEVYRKIYDGNVIFGEDLMEIVP